MPTSPCLHRPAPPGTAESRARHLPIAAAAGTLVSAVWLRSADPVASGGLGPCPIRSMTGLWCPGCGLTRATHRLLHGDVVEALSFNVLVPLVLAGLAVAWFTWFRVASGAGAPARVRAVRASTYALAAAAVAVFVAVRNLPGMAVLRGG